MHLNIFPHIADADVIEDFPARKLWCDLVQGIDEM